VEDKDIVRCSQSAPRNWLTEGVALAGVIVRKVVMGNGSGFMLVAVLRRLSQLFVTARSRIEGINSVLKTV
jgi:hypothetical protein